MSTDPTTGLVRWRLDLAYDGTDFSGWAAQTARRTVQGEVQGWLRTVLRLDTQPRLVVAGRTDAGVHARGQVAHVDLPAELVTDGRRLRERLNRALPADVVVLDCEVAPAEFDARFGAVWRRYVYRLADGDRALDPLLRRHVAVVASELDLARVNAGGAILLGLRDFAAFCRRRDGASTVRTLLEVSAARVTTGPYAGIVECTVRADAFCHSMVRSLMGALVSVGSSRRDLDWLRGLTAATSRDPGVPVLPAHGLTLEEVGYPADDELAARVLEARSRRSLDER